MREAGPRRGTGEVYTPVGGQWRPVKARAMVSFKHGGRETRRERELGIWHGGVTNRSGRTQRRHAGGIVVQRRLAGVGAIEGDLCDVPEGLPYGANVDLGRVVGAADPADVLGEGRGFRFRGVRSGRVGHVCPRGKLRTTGMRVVRVAEVREGDVGGSEGGGR